MKNFVQVRSAILTLLAVSFVTFFSAGCGDSREDFVVTNNNNNGPNTGNLVFRLQQAAAQTIATVPNGTTTVRFDLFSTNPPGNSNTLVSTQTRQFAPVITLTDVPTNVQSVVLTTFNSDNLPTGVFTAAVTVTPGGSNEVNLGNAVPATFDSFVVTPDPVNIDVSFPRPNSAQQQLTLTGTINGTQFALPINANSVTFTLANPAVANISASGLVTIQNPGSQLASSTNVTATYTLFSTPRTDTFTINSRVFGVTNAASSVLSPGETYNSGYGTIFGDSNGETISGVANAVTYALQTPVTGVTVSSTGVVTTTADTPEGEFFVIATFVDNTRTGATGLTFTDEVRFVVERDT